MSARTANSGNSLRHLDVTQLTMVVRDQLPLVINAECADTGLLDDQLLTSGDLLTLTSDDVRLVGESEDVSCDIPSLIFTFNTLYIGIVFM